MERDENQIRIRIVIYKGRTLADSKYFVPEDKTDAMRIIDEILEEQEW